MNLWEFPRFSLSRAGTEVRICVYTNVCRPVAVSSSQAATAALEAMAFVTQLKLCLDF